MVFVYQKNDQVDRCPIKQKEFTNFHWPVVWVSTCARIPGSRPTNEVNYQLVPELKTYKKNLSDKKELVPFNYHNMEPVQGRPPHVKHVAQTIIVTLYYDLMHK